MSFDNHYVTIDLDVIQQNIASVRAKAGVKVMAVVKADAYGHGAKTVSRLLEDSCDFFGISSIAEGLELRYAGIQKPILILGRTPRESFSKVVHHRIRPTIFHWEDALALSEEAQKQGVTAPFHFAVDTGMSRIGLPATEEAAELCVKIAALPGLQAEGLFSHFATADCADLSDARQQARLFARFDEMLRQKGLHIPIRHLSNSAGIMNFGCEYEMVRSGIVTYGLYPSGEVDQSLLSIRPALSWHSRIAHLQLLPSGRAISYGGTFVTQKPTVVATIPVGYADGYCRNLSNRYYVLIRGQRAPILGRICMDQMMVDVTGIEDVALEDTVTLIGKDGCEEITVEAIAEAAGSFNYEFICGISRRVPRMYLRNGKEVHRVHYLLDPPGTIPTTQKERF